MSSKSNSSDLSETFKLDRSKALADGVFAIVVTLLVLGIDVPSDHNFSKDGLFLFLERIGFQVFTYAISFWLAATYWLQHSAIMHYYRHGNRTVVWLNLLFLFPVTLLPFVTVLRTDYRYESLVTLLFGLLQIFIGLVLVALWNYAVSHPYLLTRQVGEDIQRTIRRRMLISPVLISLIAIPVSFISIHVSGLLFLSIPLYYLSHHDIDQNWTDDKRNNE